MAFLICSWQAYRHSGMIVVVALRVFGVLICGEVNDRLLSLVLTDVKVVCVTRRILVV
jgi:hypothetical protein